jgi:16S rRNA G1207 methylase RsmC
VEISTLHAKVLEAKGFAVHCLDFLSLSPETLEPVDCVVMNPPFADGRAKSHVQHAARFVRSGGRLVAVLPASMAGKPILGGYSHSWSQPYENAFAGTGAVVVILTAQRVN